MEFLQFIVGVKNHPIVNEPDALVKYSSSERRGSMPPAHRALNEKKESLTVKLKETTLPKSVKKSFLPPNEIE